MYEIAIYLNEGFGLMETATANDKDTLLDMVHDMVCRNRGCFCEIENTETGETVDFSEKEYFGKIYYEGEIDIDI